ncbi:MAG: CidA/LrgA family protein [Pseudomonadota bacterium]|nr:CidA/LrgA family protein [Pseudomonadota bacterium]
MLDSIFIIFMFQLVGEATQKYFALPVPGPVIGLVLMLVCLLWTKRTNLPLIADQRDRLVTTSQQLLGYLSLLFVPIGVGVIMHLQLLEAQLAQIIAVITIGTIVTMVFTAFIFLKTGGGATDE